MNKSLLIVFATIAAVACFSYPSIAQRARKEECAAIFASISEGELDSDLTTRRFNEISARLPAHKHLRELFEKVRTDAANVPGEIQSEAIHKRLVEGVKARPADKDNPIAQAMEKRAKEQPSRYFREKYNQSAREFKQALTGEK